MDDRATLKLEEELGRINERFESGEMKAFGRGQPKLLEHFDEIRRAQARLAERQVALSMERMSAATLPLSLFPVRRLSLTSFFQEDERRSFFFFFFGRGARRGAGRKGRASCRARCGAGNDLPRPRRDQPRAAVRSAAAADAVKAKLLTSGRCYFCYFCCWKKHGYHRRFGCASARSCSEAFRAAVL